MMQFQGDLIQIGMVVRDLDHAMAQHRQMLGLNHFLRMDTDYQARYRHWTGRIANRNAFAKWGTVHLEMTEPGLGEGIQRDWLDTRGEGINHLAYATDDMSQRPGGAEICFETLSLRQADGSPAILFLDTVDKLGYYMELIHRSVADSLNKSIDEFFAEVEA